MRSAYRPSTFTIPRTLSPAESIFAPVGGDCAGAKGSRRGSLAARSENAVAKLLAPLVEQSGRHGSHLSFSLVGEFRHGACRYQLPRFFLAGPPGGGVPIRLGFFAALAGDEPESATALRDFLLALDADPALAEGYEIYAYPVCNPSGLEDGTRHSRAGCHLDQEFWRGSKQPEVYFLERELGVLDFTGLVTLHRDPAASSTSAHVQSATLAKALVKPALAAADRFLPPVGTDHSTPRKRRLSGRDAEILSNGDELAPAPFELALGVPGLASPRQQSAATTAALKAILQEYRQFLAFARDL